MTDYQVAMAMYGCEGECMGCMNGADTPGVKMRKGPPGFDD